MRQFLFSSAIVSSIATGVGLLRKTLRAPLSWQTWLLWLSWVISLILAVSSVLDKKSPQGRSQVGASRESPHFLLLQKLVRFEEG